MYTILLLRVCGHVALGLWWQQCYSFQVCELDIIFNFEKAYYMLDELLIAGEVQETSKKNVLKAIAAQDMLQEVCSSFLDQSSKLTHSSLISPHSNKMFI